MKTKSILGVVLGLLLFATAQAQAHHYTYEDVNTIADLNLQYGARPMPLIWLGAQVGGYGIWDDGHGNYTADNTQEALGSLADADYEAVMAYTGDPILAAEAAAGLLTEAELRRARGEDSFGGGSWGSLNTFYGAFGQSYTYQGSGGGGYLN